MAQINMKLKDKLNDIERTILWLIVLASAIAITIRYFIEPLDTNGWAGVLVAALSVLVAALLGWQIFNAIYFERRLRRIERKTDKFQESLLFQKNYADAATTYLNANIIRIQAEEANSEKLFAEAYKKYYKALDLFLKSSFDIASECIDRMGKCHERLFKKYNKSKFANEQFDSYCEDCYESILANLSKLPKDLRDRIDRLRHQRQHPEMYQVKFEDGEHE